jgi:hypothetical protein
VRVDARSDLIVARNWRVYHAEQMRFLTTVVWADDETNEYAVWGSFCDILTGYEPLTMQAKRIAIYTDRMLVVINPIADDQDVSNKVDDAVCA